MDPLSVTASAVALATAALQSAKALHDLVDGLADAPHSVSHSKSLLSQTQTTLGTLARTLETNCAPDTVDSVLKEIELNKVLESTKSICQGFTAAITRVTSHSTDSHFSKRDRLAVYFKDTKINKLNKDLADCQRTITMVLSSITLIVSSRTSGNIDQLRTQFATQEQALANLSAQLSIREPEPQADDDGIAAEGDSSARLTDSLRDVCQKTLSVTRAWRTGQKFGDMKTDDHSIAMQGIVGVAQPGVDQSFGSLTTTKSSRAFQGQMDAGSFSNLFSK
ncbi:Prion amyloid fibrils-forming protein [Podospora pseudopauciseta]|uniref:Prion amyloid fibrils-forming protein n=1 Tax=Podospora pseudopauciseta TaxID=2093780 RepID=A0ABR0HI10_9PEZI|nr:Prion amyloid fibrils-forming protein [Podospora pseudopauciseta]